MNMKEEDRLAVESPPDEAGVADYPRYWLPDGVYKFLKWGCLVGIPAIGSGYQLLSAIWGFPYAEAVPQTLYVVALVLGVLIGVSEIKGMGGGADA